MASTRKQQLVDELVTAFRTSGNQDSAFDNLAAERLGINRTDLLCLNAIENSGGLTAGQIAAHTGLTTGAVTGVVHRLQPARDAPPAPAPPHPPRAPPARRRVAVEVTPAFYEHAAEIWGPLKADWDSTLAGRFTASEL